MRQFLVGIGTAVIFIAYSLWVRSEQALPPQVASVTKSPPTSIPATPRPQTNSSQYKDGTFTGSTEDAFYGNVQVSATIAAGRLTDVKFLQYPHDHSDSIMINQQAMPLLIQEAIQTQHANVDVISGATFTSEAFQQSLATALAQAKAS